MAKKLPGPQVDGTDVPLRLTVAQHRALQAAARGEVFRTVSSIANTLTGPCGSKPLWALGSVLKPLVVDHAE